MANAITSATGTVASDTVTLQKNNNQGYAFLLLSYTKGDGTSVAVTSVAVKNKMLGISYKKPASEASAATLGAWTVNMTASGNYRIKLDLAPSDYIVEVVITFTGGTTQAIQVDLI